MATAPPASSKASAPRRPPVAPGPPGAPVRRAGRASTAWATGAGAAQLAPDRAQVLRAFVVGMGGTPAPALRLAFRLASRASPAAAMSCTIHSVARSVTASSIGGSGAAGQDAAGFGAVSADMAAGDWRGSGGSGCDRADAGSGREAALVQRLDRVALHGGQRDPSCAAISACPRPSSWDSRKARRTAPGRRGGGRSRPAHPAPARAPRDRARWLAAPPGASGRPSRSGGAGNGHRAACHRGQQRARLARHDGRVAREQAQEGVVREVGGIASAAGAVAASA